MQKLNEIETGKNKATAADGKRKKELSAREWAYRLLDRRDYSEKGLFEKLQERFSEQDAAEAVGICVKRGFVNDRRYGEFLCRRYGERYGKRRVYTELCRKGIPNELAKELIAEAEEENEAGDNDGKLLSLIRKKLGGMPLTRENRGKTAAFLARRGYTGEDIERLLRAYRENINTEETEAEE